GQEINTGEAGITEWIDSLLRGFPDWDIHVSSRLNDIEYAAGGVLKALAGRPNVQFNDALHLGVSMRSFRAENVSALVKHLLDRDETDAQKMLAEVDNRYPIVITRSVERAKTW